MSHFSVIVIGPDPDRQLAPYNEQPAEGDHSCKREWVDETDNYTKEYENDTVKQIKLVDGTLHWPWDSKFKVAGAHPLEQNTVYPEGAIEVDVPFKDIYPDFDAFVLGYHGMYRNAEGRYGYWHYPNAKWDWYQLGGRWTGYFRLKPGRMGALGKPGLQRMDDDYQPPNDQQYADAVRKGDVDVEYMRDDAGKKAGKRWDDVHAIIAGREFITWPDMLKKHGVENINAARDEYHAQDVVQDLKGKLDFFEEPSRYLVPREDFVAEARLKALVPFAYVKDGEWHENKKMGWFGMSSEPQQDPTAWAQAFNDMFEALPDDTLLYCFDCHI